MTTAFVLWGVGSLGAAQVGMLRSLTAAGVRPDVVVGASVGALNGVYYAARPHPDGVEELAGLWEAISHHDVLPLSPYAAARALAEDLPWSPVRGLLRAMGITNYTFPLDPMTLLTAAMGRANHLIDSGRFRRLLEEMLPVERLEQTEIPVEVLTTDALSGQAVSFSEGPVLPALMASTAIPSIYPTVELDGRMLVDGAIADQTVLDWAVRHGADDIYLLTPGLSSNLPELPSNALAMTLHSYNMLAEHSMASAMARALMNTSVRLHQLPPVSPMNFLPVDFTNTIDLIERATASTNEWLAER